MRRIVILLIIFLIYPVSVLPENYTTTCSLGFNFEVSEDKSWGYKEPVIVDITPGSPAERAGLKLNDIILSVNGNGTYLKSHQTVMSWFNLNETSMKIAIRNLEHSFKELNIDKDCRHSNGIRESQLAPVFAFYSLEDVQERRFLMPVKTKTNSEALLHDYRTFAFSPSGENTRELDEQINAIFTRVLTDKGMRYSPDDPDLIIQTYYSYQNNPLFKPDSPTYGSYQPVWRFDSKSNRTVKIPLYNPSEAVRVDDIAFNLEFGYRFYDNKFIEAGKMILIWESEVKERLSSHYDLLNYLGLNLPLMLQKFPYPGNLAFATYQVKYLKYNYTGIGYNMNDLKTVVSVDPGSPAAQAGILPGDIILDIQGQSFNHTPQSLTDGYRRFLAETMNFRDRNTRYTDSNGFQECMFWDVSRYNEISKAISDNKRYKAAFSYLFNFNQYIDWNTPLTINIIVDRGGNMMNFAVTPQISTSSHILAY